MPKKKWGQNFLRNRGAADRIVAAVEPREGERIVEIGPGEGVLTGKLVDLGVPVTAIEIDPDLAARLRQRFGEGVEIRNEDALQSPLPEIPFRAVGNLPYNAGTPILRRVIASPNVRRAVFMLQKEVADRIVARPGSEPYGFLTLYVQMFAAAKILLTLDPKSFHPAPKVRSSVVVLDPRPPAYQSDADLLIDLISTSFRMRRKKLINNLIGWRGAGRDHVLAAMRHAKINEDVRAEAISLQEFDRLARALTQRVNWRPGPAAQ